MRFSTIHLILFFLLPLSITSSDPIISTTDIPDTTTTISEIAPCECNISEHLEKAEYTLREDIKITQIRLVEPVRTAIGYAMSEKQHLLNFARYATLRDVLKTYPSLIHNTEFVLDFDEFFKTVTKLLVDDTNYSSAGIKHQISMAMSGLMKRTLPQGFLCLAVGKCRTVPFDYSICMDKITNWEIYLSDTSRKAANHLADAIYRYRKMESIIVEIHQQLMNATNMTLSETCLSRYVDLAMCNCSRPCSSTCIGSMEICFGDFNSQWAAKLLVLRTMTSGQGILSNFMRMKKSILDSIRVLVERKSPLYAEHVTAQCGPLGDLFIHPKKQNFTLTKPTTKYTAHAEKAAKELQLSIKTWEKLSRQVCNSSSVFSSIGGFVNEMNCTTAKTVKSLQSVRIEDQLPPITKDVRPRPMIEALEKERLKKLEALKNPPEYSGRMPNWDDEEGDDDFDGNNSGSGAPPQIIDNSPPNHPKSIIDKVMMKEDVLESLASTKYPMVIVILLTILLR